MTDLVTMEMTPTAGEIVYDAGDPRSDGITITAQNLSVIMREMDGCPVISGSVNIGMQPAGFHFRITRDDGILMTDAFAINFVVRDAQQNLLPIVASYDSETGYWFLEVVTPVETSGFWVAWLAPDSVWAQYRVSGTGHYVYRLSEFFDADNLIQMGVYEASAPYWKVEDIDDLYTPELIDIVNRSEACALIADNPLLQNTYGYLAYYAGVPFTVSKTVKTSISYKINYLFYQHIAFYWPDACGPGGTDNYYPGTIALDFNGEETLNVVYNQTPTYYLDHRFYYAAEIQREISVENVGYAEHSPYLGVVPNATPSACDILIRTKQISGTTKTAAGPLFAVTLAPDTD